MRQHASSATQSSRDRQGFYAAVAAIAATLALILFTHVATCLPCYDDDVCAGARIDHVVDLGFAKVVEAGSDKGNCTLISLPDRFHADFVFIESVVGLRPDTSGSSSANRERPSRNSALEHRRTVVLLI